MIELDAWQQEVIDYDGNIALRSGRQVGKTECIAQKTVKFATSRAKMTVIIVAAVERQAYLLFERVLGYLVDNHKSMIKKGREKPTKHIIRLTNGSMIYCLPAGQSGIGIRGFKTNLLIIDEAAFCGDIFSAVTPMLAATNGKIVLLSTPFGKGGYFYERFNDPSFKTWHISSEDCPRIDKEFLKRERLRMTKVQYAQEYLGEFVDELRQFFPSDLIKACMTLPRDSPFLQRAMEHEKFCGIDIASMGSDESVIISVARINRETVKMIDMEVTTKTFLTDTIRRIKNADRRHDFRKIYIDDGGMGVGVFQPLLEDDQTKRKIIAINNATRSLDKEATRHKKLMKEDLYFNLLKLMEEGKIELFDEPEIRLSLMSVQYEVDPDTKDVKLFGNYTHIAEALVRAAWCMKDKTLNIWIR